MTWGPNYLWILIKTYCHWFFDDVSILVWYPVQSNNCHYCPTVWKNSYCPVLNLSTVRNQMLHFWQNGNQLSKKNRTIWCNRSRNTLFLSIWMVMTAPAPHGQGFGMHEPSMKSTNAGAETIFIISCTMAFPYSRCSLVLFLKSQAVTNKMFVFLVLAN